MVDQKSSLFRNVDHQNMIILSTGYANYRIILTEDGETTVVWMSIIIFEYCSIRKIVCLHFVVVALAVLPVVVGEQHVFWLGCWLLFAWFPFYDGFFLHQRQQCSPCKWPWIALKRVWTYSSCWELKLCLTKTVEMLCLNLNQKILVL